MVAVHDAPGRSSAAPRQHELVGRDDELRVVGGLVADLARGRSGLLTINGAPGSGRSALLEAMLADARAAGLNTAAAQSSPLETDVPYSTAAQQIALLCPPEQLTRISSAWAEGAATNAPIPFLRKQILDVAARRPLLLAVDDHQWIDPWSLAWCHAMLRHLDRAPVLMVRTVRDTAPETDGGARWDETVPVPPRRVRLGPLTVPDVAELLSRYGPADRDFAAATTTETEGNPAVLRLVLEEFHRAGLGFESRHVPRLRVHAAEAVAHLVGRTLRGLPADHVELLRAITFCGGEFDFELACALAGLHGHAAARARTSLRHLGLICESTEDGVPRASSPAVATGVLAEMEPAEREELHGRAAEIGHRAAVEPCALADMLLNAPQMRRRWAVETLVEAAERHRQEGRHERATELLRRALREPVPGDCRQRLLTRLAAIEVAHAPAASDGRLRQVLTDAVGAGDTALLVQAADLLVARGDSETARRELATVCARVRSPALDALGLLADELCAPAPEPLAVRLPPVPEEAADPAQAGLLAWRCARLGRRPDLVRTLAREALADRGPELPLATRIAACHALACRDDAAEAAAGLTAVIFDACRRGARAAAAYALVQRAVLAAKDDRCPAAGADLAAAVRQLPLHCWHPALLPHYLAARIGALLRLEDVAGAERVAAAELPLGAERGMGFAYLLHARGELRLATGDPATALGYFQECGRMLRAKEWLNPAVLSWRMPAAIAQGRLGAARAATRLIGEELELAERWGMPGLLEPVHRKALSALALAGSGPAGPGTAGIPRMGAALRAALSVPERRAASLAARGLSNKDIAQELGVTVRTVELRLTKSYRKLGIEGRAQLPPDLAE
ncbi:AAA family ATPase [Saccharopolyspora sp. 6M]|uniref:AAA family ATPase n=1 Tax=Saccharopolyspora sp. 6M TaxID=2877237 RepID=UPI001CD55F02|nr:LuxR family transcriptional regulator [Saccharopolyspora sp. 6M]MCA1227983.1 AAA family ATPase [Saccharopolyspora sp. 6M]